MYLSSVLICIALDSNVIEPNLDLFLSGRFLWTLPLVGVIGGKNVYNR